MERKSEWRALTLPITIFAVAAISLLPYERRIDGSIDSLIDGRSGRLYPIQHGVSRAVQATIGPQAGDREND